MRQKNIFSRDFKCWRLIFIFLLTFYFQAGSAWADNTSEQQSSPVPKGLTDPRFRETYKQLQVYNDRPSMDTTSLYFDMGKFRYKIPRNYIVNMSDWSMRSNDNLLTIRATFPGFEPFTEKNKDCLTKPRLYLPAGCEPVSFYLQTGKLDPSIHSLGDDDHFNNARKLFHSQIPKKGPNGFEMYETGPDDARIETYRKKSALHTLLFHCMIFSTTNRSDAVCNNTGSPLPQGGWLSYRLRLDEIKDAEQIDNGIRKLINAFIIKGEKP